MSKALLIVHGIGEQLRGQTTEKLIHGLSAACGSQLAVTRDADGHATAVMACGVRVALYEVFWADLLTREKNRGALTWSTVSTLVWHPLLCRRAKLLSAAEYPAPLVLAWLAFLLPASLLAYPIAQGARVLVQPFDEERQKRVRDRVKDMPLLQRAQAVADAATHDETMVEATLEGVVADIPNYMSSAACGEGVAFDVLARFHAAMRDAGREHDDISILAHSLGTVVAYHALTGMGQPPGELPYAPRRLFTIGSPLEKIRFFWPWTILGRRPSSHPEFQWTNFHHGWDAVSGALRRFKAWAPVKDVPLKGGGGLLRSHVVYERSPEFLGTLTEALFGQAAVPPIPWWRRLLDRAITTAENLAAPIAVVVAMLLGLASMAIVVLAFPYFMSVALRVFGADAWAGRAADWLSVLMLLVMSVLVVRHVRSCYRAACVSVADGERRSSAPVFDRVV